MKTFLFVTSQTIL